MHDKRKGTKTQKIKKELIWHVKHMETLGVLDHEAFISKPEMLKIIEELFSFPHSHL